MSAIFMGIDYDERDGSGYKAVVITHPNKTVTRFETGDVAVDYRAARLFGDELRQQTGEMFMLLSSCDHFVMDVPGYCWTADEFIHRALSKLPLPSTP